MRHKAVTSLAGLSLLVLAAACSGDDDTQDNANTQAQASAGKSASSGSGASRAGAGSGGRGGASGAAPRAGGSATAGATAGRAATAGSAGPNAQAGRGTNAGRGGAAVSGHGGGGQGGQAAAVVLSDAQIAAIVSAANAGEIAQNNVAQQKATHAQARTLATDFVDMHTMAQAQLDTLLTTLKITPEDNAITAELKQTSDTIINRLQAADEAVFDTVWLQSQIDVHIRVLELIDSMLLPNAIAPQLHDALLQTRALVSDHLARARALADTLDLDVDAGVAELDAGI